MLNINHLSRTRSIASLPCKIVLGDLMGVGEGVKKSRKEAGLGHFLPTWGFRIYLRLSSSFFLRSGFLFFSGFFLFVGLWHIEFVARVEHVGILQLWISLAELVGAQTVAVCDAFERFAFTHAVACWTGIFLLRFSLYSDYDCCFNIVDFFEIICSTLKNVVYICIEK